MKSFEKIEKFFELDLTVKKLITESRPKFNNTNIVDIEKDLVKNLRKMELSLLEMIKCAEIFIDIEPFFEKYREELYYCGYNLKNFVNFYEKNILNITNGLDESLVNNISGYSIDNNYNQVLKSCNTVNDLLQSIHFFAINDENFYKNDSLVYSKNNEGIVTNLYGKSTYESKQIFELMPIGKSDNCDILSFNDKIIMMIRSVGHATVIEVTYELDNCRISYHIPKICNVDMISNLPGINKVDENTNFLDGIAGEYVVKRDDLVSSINNFISNLPDDFDIKFSK